MMREDPARRVAHSRLAVRTEQWLRHAGDRTAQHGPYIGEVARMLTNLGIVLQQLGELEAARTCIGRAAGIFERSLGPHPHTKQARTIPKSLGG